MLLAIGVAGSSAYASSSERQLKPGQTDARSPGYTLTYKRLDRSRPSRSPNAIETRAVLARSAAARNGTLKTGVNNYFERAGTSREVGIHTNWLARRGPVRDPRPAATATTVFFKVLVKPLVNLIWIAGIVFLFGSLVALWPDAREQRRLVARLALARA